ncbi:hypothetical protein Droror1_Dr00026936 [Drosera rotundifolia]
MVTHKVVLRVYWNFGDIGRKQEKSGNDEIYDQLEQALTKAENARREDFEESKRQRKAEKDTIDAIRKLATDDKEAKTGVGIDHLMVANYHNFQACRSSAM